METGFGIRDSGWATCGRQARIAVITRAPNKNHAYPRTFPNPESRIPASPP